MKPQKPAKNLTGQHISQIVGYLKNPLTANISFLIDHSEVLKELGAIYFERFLIKYPQINSVHDIYKIIGEEKDILEILSAIDRERITNILSNNKLNDKNQQLELLNLIAIHFIFIDALNIGTHKIIREYFKKIKLLNELIKIENTFKKKLKSFSKSLNLPKYNYLDKSFNSIPPEIMGFLKELKMPARKPVTPSINQLVYLMVGIAKNAGIKNHYPEFIIPVLKELKNIYPDQFREITSFDKTYLAGRAKSGSDNYKQ